MTESDWLTSTDPAKMLEWARDETLLHPIGWQSMSARKLRLFACACCRAVWDGAVCPSCNGRKRLKWPVQRGEGEFEADCQPCSGTGLVGGLTDPRSRRAVEVAERFADGLTTEGRLRNAWLQACALEPSGDADRLCRYAALNADSGFGWMIGLWGKGRLAKLVPSAASLLRHLIGNPFHPVVSSVGFWPETIRLLAQGVYDGANHWYALHDAIEEFGVVEIAAHFNEPGHPKGCWALDLILGKS